MSQNTELPRVKSRIKALAEKTVANGCTKAEAMAAAEMVGRLLERRPIDGCVAAIAQFCDRKVWPARAVSRGSRFRGWVQAPQIGRAAAPASIALSPAWPTCTLRDGPRATGGHTETMDSMAPGRSGSEVFHAAVEMSLVPIVLADSYQDDCPIVFANGAFCELTGYAVAEIVGRNCRFLQGPATDRTAVARIRKAISARWNVCEEIVNYRKDGSPFWNALFVNPVFDQGGKLVYIFGTLFDVTRRRALEDGLQKSNELLSVVRSGVAAALALPTSDVQRQHLQMAQSATSEAAGGHEALLQTRSKSKL